MQATKAKPATARRTRRPERPESLTERIYATLRTEILTCVLEPGRDISEAELAERFEVSKTPVREALGALRSDGLVRTFPRRGYQVSQITFGDLAELFDVRTILEAGAAEIACQTITPAELERLAALADVVYDSLDQPVLAKFIAANRDFHIAIARASGNERLEKLVTRQLDELERFFYLGARLRDVSVETTDDHREIVRVLAQRDPAAARAIMIRHNAVTRQGLFAALAQTKSFSHISI